MAAPFPAISQRKAELFWSRVTKRGEDECWLWTSTGRCSGYGYFHITKKDYIGAHRIAFALTYGSDKLGEDTCHTCDNKACCNPKHLFAGTREDNLRDCKSKKRHQYGTGHWKALLNEEKVVAIRKAYRFGTSAESLAAQYGVTAWCITEACEGKNWRHVPDEKPTP